MSHFNVHTPKIVWQVIWLIFDSDVWYELVWPVSGGEGGVSWKSDIKAAKKENELKKSGSKVHLSHTLKVTKWVKTFHCFRDAQKTAYSYGCQRASPKNQIISEMMKWYTWEFLIQQNTSPLFLSNPPGVITGVCLQDEGRCEIDGWCPAENDSVKM